MAERGSRSGRVVGGVLLLCTALAVVGYLAITRASPRTTGPVETHPFVESMPWSGPIPGSKADLATVLSSSTFSVPLLSETTVTNPCTGTTDTLRLLGSWTQSTEIGSSAQIGFVYSDGVWVSLAPVSEFRGDAFKGEELLPVEDALAEQDVGALYTASIRGHVAWLRPLAKDFSCEEDVTAAIGPDGETLASPGMSSPDQEANKMFSPFATASLRWVEHGVMIHVTGPYSIDEMERIVDQVDWR